MAKKKEVEKIQENEVKNSKKDEILLLLSQFEGVENFINLQNYTTKQFQHVMFTGELLSGLKTLLQNELKKIDQSEDKKDE